eukprot:gene5725-8750_t
MASVLLVLARAVLYFIRCVVAVVSLPFGLASFALPWRIFPGLHAYTNRQISDPEDITIVSALLFLISVGDVLAIAAGLVTLCSWRAPRLLDECLERREEKEREYRYNHGIRWAVAVQFFWLVVDFPFAVMAVLCTLMVWRAPFLWYDIVSNLNSEGNGKAYRVRLDIFLDFCIGFADILLIPFGLLILLSVYRLKPAYAAVRASGDVSRVGLWMAVERRLAVIEQGAMVVVDFFTLVLLVLSCCMLIRIPAQIRDWKMHAQSASDRREAIVVNFFLSFRDLAAAVAHVFLWCTVYRGFLALLQIRSKTATRADPRPHCRLTKVTPFFPAEGGFHLLLEGQKTRDLRFTTARLHASDPSFWDKLSQRFGSAVAVAKAAFPYKITPEMLRPADFAEGETRFSTPLVLRPSGSKASILRNLDKVAEAGISTVFEVEFDEGAGTLFRLAVDFLDLAACAKSGDGGLPISAPVFDGELDIANETTANLKKTGKRIEGELFCDALAGPTFYHLLFFFHDVVAAVLFVLLHLVPWRAYAMYRGMLMDKESKLREAAIAGLKTARELLEKREPALRYAAKRVDERAKMNDFGLRYHCLLHTRWEWVSYSRREGADDQRLPRLAKALTRAAEGLAAKLPRESCAVAGVASSLRRVHQSRCSAAAVVGCSVLALRAEGGAPRALLRPPPRRTADIVLQLSEMVPELADMPAADAPPPPAGGAVELRRPSSCPAEDLGPVEFRFDGSTEAATPPVSLCAAAAAIRRHARVEAAELLLQENLAAEVASSLDKLSRERATFSCKPEAWSETKALVFTTVKDFAIDLLAFICLVCTLATVYRIVYCGKILLGGSSLRTAAFKTIREIGLDILSFFATLLVILTVRSALSLVVALVEGFARGEKAEGLRGIVSHYLSLAVYDLICVVTALMSVRAVKYVLGIAAVGLFTPGVLISFSLFPKRWSNNHCFAAACILLTAAWAYAWPAVGVFVLLPSQDAVFYAVYLLPPLLAFLRCLQKGFAARFEPPESVAKRVPHVRFCRVNWHNFAQFSYPALEGLLLVSLCGRALFPGSGLWSGLLLDFKTTADAQYPFGTWMALSLFCAYFVVTAMPVVVMAVNGDTRLCEYNSWVFLHLLLSHGTHLLVVFNLARVFFCTGETSDINQSIQCFEGDHRVLGLLTLLSFSFYSVTTVVQLPEYSSSKASQLDVVPNFITSQYQRFGIVVVGLLCAWVEPTGVAVVVLAGLAWQLAFSLIPLKDCAANVYNVWQIFCTIAAAAGVIGVLVADRASFAFGLIAGLGVLSGALAASGCLVYKLWNQDVDGLVVTPEQLQQALTQLADKLLAEGKVFPDFKFALWKRRVARCNRASPFALALMQLEYNTRLEACHPTYLAVRDSWYNNLWSLVDYDDSRDDIRWDHYDTN